MGAWVSNVLSYVFESLCDLHHTYLSQALKEIFENSYPLVASTAVYATALYWVFYMSSIATAFGGSADNPWTSLKADKARASTAAALVRLSVGIFAASRLFNSLGLNIEQVVQIGSIFSLGISWSMRDSLSSLWASLLMTFTTDVLDGAEIRFNGEWFKVVHRWSTFVECEWLDSEDINLDDPVIKAAAAAAKQATEQEGFVTVPNFRHFIPAASLLDRGFTIKQQK